MNIVKDFNKMRLNLEIFTNIEDLREKTNSLNALINQEKNRNNIFCRKIKVSERAFLMNFVIIDMECDPPKFFGILLFNQIFQIYVKTSENLSQLYTLILKILELLRNYYMFSFSNYEWRFINQILPYKVNSDSDAKFIETLKIVNIQKTRSEGLVSALYSLDECSYHDPLLRDSKKVELHFKRGNYYHILEHNKSCLLSTLKIVQKRYLKLNLI